MSRHNSVDWQAQSDPMRNPKFRRPWELPLRLEETQANKLLRLIGNARTLFAEGRDREADNALSDAMIVVRQHRDRRHPRLRREAQYDRL